MANRILFDRVGKRFEPTRGGSVVTALEGLSLAIADRSFVCLVGPSGCGKSTLLNLLAGFEKPTAGQVLLDGRPVRGPAPDRGVVFQEAALFPWLTVLDNVCYGPRRRRVPRSSYIPAARALLEQVGLARFADNYPNELSGGMRQRTAIARALVNDPEVLLLDEPFGALDAQTRSMMQELLLAIWERHHRTVLFVTHDVEEAVFLADRVIVMSRAPGRIMADVTIDLPRPRSFEVLTEPAFTAYKRDVLTLVRQEARAVAGERD
ncbi:ABC transporter ATP-binding protein [Falsiroseomonas sp. HW251]|uniref:ABC transporter ATP-binding protein n=1 Tax=Falsiroseomonas sp. HW251 TaxID=3390998 RepID=UPI003D31B83D